MNNCNSVSVSLPLKSISIGKCLFVVVLVKNPLISPLFLKKKWDMFS